MAVFRDAKAFAQSVKEVLDVAPPLTDEKRDKITALFQAGDRP